MTEPTALRLLQWSEKLRSASGIAAAAVPDTRDLAPSATTMDTIERLLGTPGLSIPGTPAALPCELWQAASCDERPLPESISCGQGWLVPALSSEGIETWQEAELMCLHALAWVGLRHSPVLERVRSAARTCIAELQPDNVTGRPWAAHVFAWMAAVDGDLDAAMYAETLVHNVLVARRQAEPASAILLLDSAAWLRAISSL